MWYSRFDLRRPILIAFLSAADFLLTWYLLHESRGRVLEGNPIAAWLLDRFGWLGLAGFKGLIAALIAGSYIALTVYCPRMAQRVFLFACAVLVSVIGYSGVLAYDLKSRPASPEEVEISRSWDLEKKSTISHERHYLLEKLSNSLAEGQIPLLEAVERFAESA